MSWVLYMRLNKLKICCGITAAIFLCCLESCSKPLDDVSSLNANPVRGQSGETLSGSANKSGSDNVAAGIHSVRCKHRLNTLLMIHLARLGQYDVINLRPGRSEEVVVNFGRFTYQGSNTTPPVITPEVLDMGRHIVVNDAEIKIDLPAEHGFRSIIDVELPSGAEVKLEIGEESRFAGIVTKPIAWRGFLEIDGAPDLQVARSFIATQFRQRITLKYHQIEYPGIDWQARNLKITNQTQLPPVFAGLEGFIIQVDKEGHIVSAAIPGLDVDSTFNQRLLEAVKPWKIKIDGDPTPFTLSVRVKPGMIKEK